MTSKNIPASGEPTDAFDGHTLEELSDYLDAGRLPADESIDYSPACQLALRSRMRVRSAATALFEQDAAAETMADDRLLNRILGAISRDLHAGRDIPLRHPFAHAEIVITEGAVKGVIRAAGDGIHGLLVGRCALIGDVTTLGAAITIQIEATVLGGENIPEAVERLRQSVAAALAFHTELLLTGIDIAVRDLYREPPDDEGTDVGPLPIPETEEPTK